MKTDLLILTESPFSKRDYERFGIEILKQYFNVLVLDCTYWLKPEFWEKYQDIRYPSQGYHVVKGRNEFNMLITGLSEGAAIDYLGENATSQYVRRELCRRNISLCIFRPGMIPYPKKGPGGTNHWFRPVKLFGRILRRFYREITDRIHPRIFPDFVVLSGEVSLRDTRLRHAHKIWAHSLDYDIYLTLRNKAGKSSDPYAVFLDEDMANHSDYFYHGIKPPVSVDDYFSALNGFFNKFERQTGLKVVIAAHPRSRYDLRSNLFNQNEVIKGRTAELVRDSSLVFAHASTAISFAVLWRKPMVFLSTNELRQSYMQPHIELRSELFHSPLVNMNSIDHLEINLEEWLQFNDAAYADYVNKYIKVSGTPDRPVWEIFSDYVRNVTFSQNSPVRN